MVVSPELIDGSSSSSSDEDISTESDIGSFLLDSDDSAETIMAILQDTDSCAPQFDPLTPLFDHEDDGDIDEYRNNSLQRKSSIDDVQDKNTAMPEMVTTSGPACMHDTGQNYFTSCFPIGDDEEVHCGGKEESRELVRMAMPKRTGRPSLAKVSRGGSARGGMVDDVALPHQCIDRVSSTSSFFVRKSSPTFGFVGGMKPPPTLMLGGLIPKAPTTNRSCAVRYQRPHHDVCSFPGDGDQLIVDEKDYHTHSMMMMVDHHHHGRRDYQPDPSLLPTNPTQPYRHTSNGRHGKGDLEVVGLGVVSSDSSDGSDGDNAADESPPSGRFRRGARTGKTGKRKPRKKYPPDVKEYTSVTDHDVLCGRGELINRHPGNISLHKEKLKFRASYERADKPDKKIYSQALVDAVRGWGGRFLAKDENGWYRIHDKHAQLKVSQVLRDSKIGKEKRQLKRLKYLSNKTSCRV